MPSRLTSSTKSRPIQRSSAAAGRFHAAWNRPAAALERWISLDFVLLVSRLGIAAVFFYSGRTKVSGLLSVTDGAVNLFRSEYRLPFVDPAIAVHAAAYAEHLFPLLLVLGFLTRGAAQDRCVGQAS